MNKSTLQLENEVLIQEPDWVELERALTQMDGSGRSMVALNVAQVGTLMAGGGNNGQFVVVFFPVQGDSLTLTNLSGIGPDIQLVVEGVLSDFRPQHVIDKPILLDVFKYFCETNKLPTKYRWEIGTTGMLANMQRFG